MTDDSYMKQLRKIVVVVLYVATFRFAAIPKRVG